MSYIRAAARSLLAGGMAAALASAPAAADVTYVWTQTAAFEGASPFPNPPGSPAPGSVLPPGIVSTGLSITFSDAAIATGLNINATCGRALACPQSGGAPNLAALGVTGFQAVVQFMNEPPTGIGQFAPSYTATLADLISSAALSRWEINLQSAPGAAPTGTVYVNNSTSSARFNTNGTGDFGTDWNTITCRNGCTLTGTFGPASTAAQSVPEPASLALFPLALAGLAAVRRRG